MLTSDRSGMGPDRTTVRIGNSEVFTSVTTGSSTSAGMFGLARSTASLTSVSASSASKPASNFSCTEAKPSEACASISSSPESDDSSVSSGRTSRRSLSSGEMPSSTALTYITGIGMSGEDSFGIA